MYDSSSKPVGTVRYLAPEYLKPELFNEYLNLTRADIYSTALVIWELLNRTKVKKSEFLSFYIFPRIFMVSKRPFQSIGSLTGTVFHLNPP